MRSGFLTACPRFFRAMKRRSRLGTLLGAAIGLAVFSVATALPASATPPSGVQLFNETFSNNTVPTSEVVLPNLPSGAAQSPPGRVVSHRQRHAIRCVGRTAVFWCP